MVSGSSLNLMTGVRSLIRPLGDTYEAHMGCSYSSASGGFGLLVLSDWAVICSAKPLRSNPLADFIKRYINKLLLLSCAHLFSHMTHDLLKKIVVD